MKEVKTSINNLTVNYKIAGEGPAVLILHGWGGSSDSWLEVQKFLADENYTVIVPDFPGFGKSITPGQAWSIKEYIEWLNNFIKEIRTFHSFEEPFFLIGHSFGGRVAIRFAGLYPQRLKKLILCDSAGIKSEPDLKARIIFSLSKIGNAVFSPQILVRFKDALRNVFYFFIRNRDYVKAEGTMKETMKKVISEDLLSDLSNIQASTLVVWGKKDKIVPVKYAYVFEEKIKDCRLELLPEIGHSPHLEVPKKLSQIIIYFLKS